MAIVSALSRELELLREATADRHEIEACTNSARVVRQLLPVI
jgi:hypothetical protein